MRISKKAVRIRMAEQGIDTQDELAERANLNKNTVSSAINGGSFSSKTLAALCAVLQCTPNDILELEGETLALAVAA